MAVRVGINGFGRIGRITFRAIAEQHWDDIEVVAVNDLAPAAMNAHLLRYDSNYGRFERSVELGEGEFKVDGRTTKIFSQRNPAEIPWGAVGAEVVIESTGFFTDGEKAAGHKRDSVKKVIISAPAKNVDLTVVLGVNEDKYNPAGHSLISNASCTTNCLAPISKVLLDNFGVVNGFMTTVHAYTNDQKVNDIVHEDARRARAAAMNMIPTSTGAAKAIGEVIPELKGKLHGLAIRVPTSTVSVVDLNVNLEKSATVEAINAALKAASEAGRMHGILGYCTDECVSSDFRGDRRSSIVDAPNTLMMGERMVKVLSWYDNEWGYSSRLGDLVCFLASKGL